MEPLSDEIIIATRETTMSPCFHQSPLEGLACIGTCIQGLCSLSPCQNWLRCNLFWELWDARLSWSTAVSVLKFAYVFACKKSKKCTKYYNCTIQINFMAYLKSVSKSGFFSVKLSYGVKNTAWEPSILYHLVFYGLGYWVPFEVT